MHRRENLVLFVDMGTNGEVVLGHKEWLICASSSAGPAFEGGQIGRGMIAAAGAIERVAFDGDVTVSTIEGARARGICGSGLISAVARMLEMGVINHQGKFERDLGTRRIRQTNDVWEYVLAWKDDTDIGRNIVLTEIDIENLIRAKGAIYSGCLTLLKEVGLDFEAVDQILLAGGFGACIDLTQAITIGLLPDVDPQRIHYIGNGSLRGAGLTLLSRQLWDELHEIARRITYFELSSWPGYMDEFMAALFLPHTDGSLFPSVKSP